MFHQLKGERAAGICLLLALPALSLAATADKSSALLQELEHLDVMDQVRMLKEAGLPVPGDLLREVLPKGPREDGPLRQGGEDFAGATVVDALPYTDTGTTAGYVDDYSPGCGFGSAPDVVYSYTPAEDITVDVDLCGSAYDTILSVFVEDASTNLACNDDYCDAASGLEFLELAGGTTYYILVDGYFGNSGEYTLNLVENTEPSPCDIFEQNYTVIPSLPFSWSDSLHNEADVWGSTGLERGFELTVDEITALRFLTCQEGNEADSRVYILDGSPCEGGTSQLQSDFGDVECAWGVSVDFTAVLAPGTWVILAGGDSEDDLGTLSLTVEVDTDWVNPCDSALPLACGSNLTVDNTGAEDFYDGSAGDLLYTFELEEFMAVEISTCNETSAIDTKLFLFDSCPFDGGVDYLDMNDDTDCDDSLLSRIEAGLEPGMYYVIATGFGSNEGVIGLDFSCTANSCPELVEPFVLRMITPDQEETFTLEGDEIVMHFFDADGDELSAEDVLVPVPQGYEGPLFFDVAVDDGMCTTTETLQLHVQPLEEPFNVEAELDTEDGTVELSWNFFEDLVYLMYDNDEVSGSYTYEGYAMSVHMSPSAPCRLMALAYYTTDTGTDSEFLAEVYPWGGSAPDTTLLHAQSAWARDGEWVYVETWMDDLEVDGDFVVGFGSLNAQAGLGFDESLDNGRSWDYDHAGGWSAWSEAYAIRAIVQYLGQDELTVLEPVSHPYQSRLAQMNGEREALEGPVVLPFLDYGGEARDFIEFNVYRDEVLLGSTAAMSYTDVLPGPGYYVYEVSALYDEGESGAEEVEVDWIEIEDPYDLSADLDPEDGSVALEWSVGDPPEALVYDNDEATGSYTYEGYAMATQMSPEGPCRLAGVAFLTTDTATDSPFRAELYGWTGDEPDTLLLGMQDLTALDNEWVYAGFFEDEIWFEGDFVVGFGSLNSTAGLAFDENLDNGRSWDYDHAGGWSAWNEAYLIRAFVYYEEEDRLAMLSPVLPQASPEPALRDLRGEQRWTGAVPALRDAARDFIEFQIYRDGQVVGTSSEPFYEDQLPEAGVYEYQVTALYDEGESGASNPVTVDWDPVGVDAGQPVSFYLAPAVPNPFNPTTRLSFGLPVEQELRLVVYNLLGEQVERVLEGRLPAGHHSVDVDGRHLASGIYFLRLEAQSGVMTRKITLLK